MRVTPWLRPFPRLYFFLFKYSRSARDVAKRDGGRKYTINNGKLPDKISVEGDEPEDPVRKLFEIGRMLSR